MNTSEDLRKLNQMQDSDIDYSDIPELTDNFWENAVIEQPQKISVTIRLDKDLVDFFKHSGPGYQTRINKILRHYISHSKH
jgi:uncharacterized protein (DUF4415 family)